MKTLLARLCLAGLAALGSVPVAQANPYAEYLVAQILPGWRQGDGEHIAGLELTLAHGWKTYWRSPGSAGIPPRFDWSGSDNVKSLQIVWPKPVVFDWDGLRSIGYKDHVVLPLQVVPKDPSQPVRLQGEINLGICEAVCVPLDVHVVATLPAEAGHRDPPIAAALAGRPYSAREARLTRVTCTLKPLQDKGQPDGAELVARLTMPSAGGSEVAVFEPNLPDVAVSDARSARQGDVLVVRARLQSGDKGGALLDRSRLKITVLGSKYAVEVQGCAAP
ncbi:hypothetical protein KM176_13375 [Pseudooceanicola sp. CBS1P-1]|uniref:Thiol:disulfide interchange protein DsbD N-terminal domain-containing protein n=1 Tax=Pseudooceanicola albus TaxID=2692189 RepID=A0A6L7G2B3_9RHOB|nr:MULTISPECIES: protein-disulfide reductase DsbD domain-containing protein [Pseudooceanicola]MBT9384855.1 hypothetical protein [Pseudooceanicola endophyticus]MXN18151.1 hypothetical protein [Pseudooceanicola albus]